MTGRRVRDSGSASMEMVLITPLLVVFVLLVVFGGRSVESTNDVKHGRPRCSSRLDGVDGLQLILDLSF